MNAKAFLALLGTICALIGCTGRPAPAPNPGTSAPPQAAAPKTLTIAVRGEPQYLVFNFGGRSLGGIGAASLSLAVHQGLAVYDERNVQHPMLAAELPSRERGTWIVRPDGTMQTTYRLRPNITWHDGTPHTTRD